MFHVHDRALFTWVASLKPGDIIGACTGFNHMVAETKILRQFVGHRGGWYVNEVRVTDTEGRWHWASGGGCVCKPYTRDEDLTFANDCASADQDYSVFWQSIVDAEKTKPFIDKTGLYVGPSRQFTQSA
jgi:hypothetical protein